MESTAVTRERKLVQNATSKVNLVVQRMLLPLLDMPLRGHILLDVEDAQPEVDLLEHMHRRHPGVMSDRASFVRYFTELFDRYGRGAGYQQVVGSVGDEACTISEEKV
jgi:hypothetical protein